MPQANSFRKLTFENHHCVDDHRKLIKKGMQIGGDGLRVKSGHVDSSETNTKWCMMNESTIKHWPPPQKRRLSMRRSMMIEVVQSFSHQCVLKKEECWQKNYDENTLAQSEKQIHATKQCMYSIKNWNSRMKKTRFDNMAETPCNKCANRIWNRIKITAELKSWSSGAPVNWGLASSRGTEPMCSCQTQMQTQRFDNDSERQQRNIEKD